MTASRAGTPGPPAAGLLDRPVDARLITINCDDFGMAPEANEATVAALVEGRATSASLIVPATHAEAAVRAGRGLPIGIHLALNSEWPQDRWRPLTAAASLTDGDGWLPRTPQETLGRSEAADVGLEWRAQIEQAIGWGVDPTHLDSHMYIAQERPDLFEIYLDLAVEYRLPVRISGSVAQRDHPFRRGARARGVVCPDHLVRLRRVGSRQDLTAALADLPAGLSEFHLHPANDSAGLRRLASDWSGRVDDARLLHEDQFWAAVTRARAEVVSYRELRDTFRTSPG